MRALLLMVCVLAVPALAQTVVQGQLNADTTWSGTVSMIGDVTVPAGRTLTIQPGTVITAAATDAQGSGANVSSVELIVSGTVNVNGAAGGTVTFQGAGTSFWYGVRAQAGASVTVGYASFARMSNGFEVGTTATVSNSTFLNNTVGLRIIGGTGNTFNSDVFTNNTNAVVMTGGTSTVSFALLHRNVSVTLQLSAGTLTVDRSTIADNSNDAFDLTGTPTLNLTSSIVTNNSGYGVDRNGGTANITYSNVWGNTNNYYSTTGGTGTISVNPLYVDKAGANYRLTSNSPARQGGVGGVDMGPLPYTSDATIGLQGSLYTNLTLSGAVGVVGDVTVKPGVTLTIQPGTTLTAAATDSMAGGANVSQVEFIIEGALQVNGTAGSVAVFQGTGSSPWYGVRAMPSATVNVGGARFDRMSNGFEVGTTVTLSNSTFQNNTVGLRIIGGTGNTFNSDVFTNNTNAVVMMGGTSTLSASVLHRNVSVTLQLSAGTLTVDRSTIADNSNDAFDLTGTPTLNLTSSIVTNNSGYGVDRNGGTANITYSNVWGNTNNYYSTTGAAGTISVNPLYVDKAGANYRLTSNSPARQLGAGGVDMGALPYVSDLTMGLQGSLYTNVTLSGAVSVLGDVTVMPGVTLTIQPGTTLTMAATDSMAGGANVSQVEFIVEGALQVNGTAGSVAVFQGTGSSPWYGVRAMPSATVNVGGARFDRMSNGFEVGTTVTVSTSTFQNNTVGLRIVGGTGNTFSNDVFTNNTNAVVMTGGTSTLSSSVLHRNVSVTAQLSAGTLTVDRSTIADNSNDAFDLTGTPTLNLTSSIVTNNSGYGVDRNGGTANITYSDVWGNTNNYYMASGSTGTISINPLYVDKAGANYRLTSNSPARFGGAGAVDMGALPYVSDATTGLQGSLYTNLSLSGAVTVLGDVTVMPGVTLTIQQGATLTCAATDSMGAGANVSQVELIVQGGLQISGSAATPSVLQGTGSSPWYGVRVLPSATVNVTGARFDRMSNGFEVGATSTVSNSTFQNNIVGLRIIGGTANVFAGDTFTNNTNALVMTGGTSTLSFSLLHRNVSVTAQLSAGTLNVDRSTISDNSNDAFDLTGTPTLNLTSSIVSSNSGYGVDRNGGTSNITYSNVWGNTNNYYMTSGGVGTITSNPLYVAQATADYHLTSNSPSRGAGLGGVDQGAFPYSVGAIDRVVISPATTSVGAAGVVGFSATAYDAANNPVTATFTWTALPAAGTITQGGVLTASCTAGTVTGAVTAAASGKSGSADVTITAGVPATVTVAPANPTVASQATQAFTAVVRDSCMNVLSNPVTWSATAGTITAGGVFTAGCTRGPAANAITASVTGANGYASVTIGPGALSTVTISPMTASVASGGQVQFNAGAADGCANPLTPALTWSTTVTGGTVSTSGLLTAGTVPGSYPMGVRVTSGAFSGSADVQVQGGLVATVTISPTTATLAQGATQQFTAEARDGNGNVVTGQPVTWSVVAAGGSITTGGLFTAGTVTGTYNRTVRATVAGVNAEATVTVLPGAVARVTVSPVTATLAPSGTTTFTAQAWDANSNQVATAITWAATPAAGTITAGGVFTAGTQAGTYSNAVTATVGTFSASASVTISGAALSQLVLMPGSTMVQAGGTVAFAVSGRDAAGNVVSVSATWSVASGGGTITQAGVFTAGNSTGTFANTVKVEASGLTAFASVTVTAGPTVFVEVSPNYAQVTAGATQAFTAVPRDAFGNPVSAMVTWAASAGGAITAGGVFTAGAIDGDFMNAISATADGMVGHASVRVIGGVVTDGGVSDGGAGDDAGSGVDGGGADAGGGKDAGMASDAGVSRIIGNNGCSCQTVDPALAFGVLAGVAVLARRRRR